MNIQDFELQSYSREIETLKKELYEPATGSIDNYTLYSLHISNRVHLCIVGLCSLVEVTLFELAQKAEKSQTFKLSDINGNGLSRLQKYLSKTEVLKFGNLRNWSNFKHVYEIRNTIIHSYSGMVESKQIETMKKSITQLGLSEKALIVGGKRLRMNIDSLEIVFTIIEDLINEIQ